MSLRVLLKSQGIDEMMRATLSLGIPLCCVAVLLSCSRSIPGARIRVEPDVFDFGAVSQGEVVHASFRVFNDGDGALRISRIIRGCGCVVASVEQLEIPAGGFDKVDFELNTSGREGVQSRKNALISNAINAPSVEVSIVGMIERNLVVTPKTISLGHVCRSSSSFISLRLRRVDGEILNITSVVDGHGKEVEYVSRDDGGETIVEVSVSHREWALGIESQVLMIRTDYSKSKNVAVPIHAVVEPDVYIEPESVVAVERIALGEGRERRIQIQNRDGTELRSLKIECDDAVCQKLTPVDPERRVLSAVLKEVRAGQEYVVQVQISPTVHTGLIVGSITITGENSMPFRRRITVTGLVVKSLSVAPHKEGQGGGAEAR